MYASILQTQGNYVEFDPPDWDRRFESILIDGIPLDGERSLKITKDYKYVSVGCLRILSLQAVSAGCLWRLSLQAVSADCLSRLSPQDSTTKQFLNLLIYGHLALWIQGMKS